MQDIEQRYRDFVGNVINAGDIDAMDDYVIEDIADSGHAGFGSGRDAMKAFVRAVRGGFPDLEMDVDLMLREGDRIGVFAPMHGTHTGPFLGIEPTGRAVRFDTCGFFRYADGMMVEHRGFADLLTLAATLGAVPPPPWGEAPDASSP
jgi:predicted ester cyclase